MAIIESLSDTPSEQLHFFNCARTFFNFCVQRKFLSANPLGTLPSPAKRGVRERLLTDAEFRQLLITAEADTSTFAKIVLMAAYTGIRRGNVAQLKWEYFNESTQTL